MVFTRTKHGAKALARQLNARGVPTVELHGNLAQNARTRNMDAFHSGRATTLVATDIAARGIHVDDVALVVHADPPVEHKAYLHRSGRTARAGAAGTVVTLMTDEQVRDVRALTRAAGIKPTMTKVDGPAHPVLAELAPGERVRVPGGLVVEAPAPAARQSSGRRQERRDRWPSAASTPRPFRWPGPGVDPAAGPVPGPVAGPWPGDEAGSDVRLEAGSEVQPEGRWPAHGRPPGGHAGRHERAQRGLLQLRTSLTPSQVPRRPRR